VCGCRKPPWCKAHHAVTDSFKFNFEINRPQEEKNPVMTTARESTQPAVKDQIREFIQENLASVKGVTSFRDDESLMDNGVIDSLGIFRLVSFLEENFGVRVSDEEINPENLKSVDTIEQLLIAKSKK
jgi:acyl carrier protein